MGGENLKMKQRHLIRVVSNYKKSKSPRPGKVCEQNKKQYQNKISHCTVCKSNSEKGNDFPMVVINNGFIKDSPYPYKFFRF